MNRWLRRIRGAIGMGLAWGVAWFGAGCATGSLALARMAEDQESLDSGADVAEAGLTEEEARELLGGGGPEEHRN